MKKIFLPFALLLVLQSAAQKIIPITHNGKKYELLDLTSKDKVMWGGFSEIKADAAKSESDGAANTKAIIVSVGDNKEYQEGKPYAAKLCSDAKDGGKEDWYLPSKNESDAIYAVKNQLAAIDEYSYLWTSTEANGTMALTKAWNDGSFYNEMKSYTYQVVCIRKVD